MLSLTIFQLPLLLACLVHTVATQTTCTSPTVQAFIARSSYPECPARLYHARACCYLKSIPMAIAWTKANFETRANSTTTVYRTTLPFHFLPVSATTADRHVSCGIPFLSLLALRCASD